MILKRLHNSPFWGFYVILKQFVPHLWCYVKPRFNGITELSKVCQRWKMKEQRIFIDINHTYICILKPKTSINMHSWLDFRWGKDLNQQPHQNVSITGTVQAIYGLHQPGRQQRSLHMTDSTTEIEAILGSCPVKHTDLMN